MAQIAAEASVTYPEVASSRGLYRDGLLIVSAALMALTLYLVYFWVPTDANLGVSQRIFYFHAPMGMVGLMAIVVVAFASIMHLVTRKERWDSLAYAAAELGVVFATLIIVTGTLWAKPVWGVWWTWDAKLTTTLILWFIYVGYLMLRAYGPKGSQGARFGSVVALIGAIDTPIIYMAANWWRTAHPEINVGPLAESGSLESRMALGLLLGLITFSVLFVYLLVERYHLRRSEVAVDELYQSLA